MTSTTERPSTAVCAVLATVTRDSLVDYMIKLGACADCRIAHEQDPYAGWCEGCSTRTEPNERGLRRATPWLLDQLHRQSGKCLSCGDGPTRYKADIPVPLCWRCARKARRLGAVSA